MDPGLEGKALLNLKRGSHTLLRVTLTEWLGCRYANIRLWTDTSKGLLPTPKGIMLRYDELDDVLHALEEANEILSARQLCDLPDDQLERIARGEETYGG